MLIKSDPTLQTIAIESLSAPERQIHPSKPPVTNEMRHHSKSRYID